jgi:hypothetical protein
VREILEVNKRYTPKASKRKRGYHITNNFWVAKVMDFLGPPFLQENRRGRKWHPITLFLFLNRSHKKKKTTQKHGPLNITMPPCVHGGGFTQ